MKGNRFRMIRLSIGLTQSELGELLGLTRLHVQAMESERRVVQRPLELLMQALADGWRPTKGWPAHTDTVTLERTPQRVS